MVNNAFVPRQAQLERVIMDCLIKWLVSFFDALLFVLLKIIPLTVPETIPHIY